MLESFLVNTRTPYVLEVEKTKLTRQLLVGVIILFLMGIIFTAFAQKPLWPQAKTLMYAIGSFKIEKLKELAPRYQALLVTLLVLIPVLLWAVKYMLSEQKFSFDSKKREIAKNGRFLSKFDSIKMIIIKNVGGGTSGPISFRLSLVVKDDRALFEKKIALGLTFKWKEATETSLKIAEIIGVDVMVRGLLRDKAFYKSE